MCKSKDNILPVRLLAPCYDKGPESGDISPRILNFRTR